MRPTFGLPSRSAIEGYIARTQISAAPRSHVLQLFNTARLATPPLSFRSWCGGDAAWLRLVRALRDVSLEDELRQAAVDGRYP